MARTNRAEIRYDREANVVHVTHPEPISLDSADVIRDYFDDVLAQWRTLTGSRRAYFMVSWSNVSTSMAANTAYAESVRRVAETAALGIVRYTGDALQRAAGRVVALKLHRPSHICASYEEALEVVDSLRVNGLSRAAR